MPEDFVEGFLVRLGLVQTGAFMVVPTLEPGSIVVMPPDTGGTISFIRFRSGTKSQPVAQMAERNFQIVLDVPAAAA